MVAHFMPLWDPLRTTTDSSLHFNNKIEYISLITSQKSGSTVLPYSLFY